MTARVVSLVPSVTETLLAWRIEPVAVTRFCEQPQLRQVGGTKDPRVDEIVALAPDLVVVNTEENRREDAEALEAAGLEVHVIDIDSVDDVEPCLRSLANAVGYAGSIDVHVPASAPPIEEPRPVFVPVWRRPWMTMSGGCYGSSMVARLGFGNIYTDAVERYPTVELDDVVARAPALVLAPSEPYPFTERHRAELETIAPVVFVDGQDLFWWGIRTPAALTRLAETLRSAIRG